MIKAILFDLDGTLIHTELLKARSYAQAITQLTANSVNGEKVINAFKKFIGQSRHEVVSGLVEVFQENLKNYFPTDTVQEIQEKVLTTRLSFYHKMIDDPSFLIPYFCEYNLDLLNSLHQDNYQIVVATMSNSAEVEKIINALAIADKLTLILTRENVREGKPNPEIYLKARDILGRTTAECLVIEDSLTGVKAALGAQMEVFAITNELTKTDVLSSKILGQKFIINDLTTLKETVYGYLKEINAAVGPKKKTIRKNT
jgi:HAD superfamily hydrolase (TIGR01509 family)